MGAARRPRVQGFVKKWDSEKGYGFLRTEGVAKDVFVHYKGIRGAGRKDLAVGQAVEFELVSGDKGLSAVDVTQAGLPALCPTCGQRPPQEVHSGAQEPPVQA